MQQIQASYAAFAALLTDGSVVAWGGADAGKDFGSDSAAVRDQLKGVQQIQASERALAAIMTDESVVTWGDADFGGDSAAVQGQLIQASSRAFAAIMSDGSLSLGATTKTVATVLLCRIS